MPKPARKPYEDFESTSAPATPEAPTSVDVAALLKINEEQKAALVELQKRANLPVLTQEKLATLIDAERRTRGAADALAEVIAVYSEIFGKAVAGDDPVWVYRYVDASGKEGFVLKSEPNAELKARRLDADKKIELGYAYPDKNDPGKFVGFVVTKKIDGTDREKY